MTMTTTNTTVTLGKLATMLTVADEFGAAPEMADALDIDIETGDYTIGSGEWVDVGLTVTIGQHVIEGGVSLACDHEGTWQRYGQTLDTWLCPSLCRLVEILDAHGRDIRGDLELAAVTAVDHAESLAELADDS